VVRTGGHKREDRSRSPQYEQVGRSLLRTAEDLATMAEAKYGNALAILAIHAAIAYTDALTVAYREMKSTDGDHAQAATLLVNALKNQVPPAEVKRLRRVLNTKSSVSYSGTYYTLAEGEGLLAEVRMYVAWAEGALRRAP